MEEEDFLEGERKIKEKEYLHNFIVDDDKLFANTVANNSCFFKVFEADTFTHQFYRNIQHGSNFQYDGKKYLVLNRIIDSYLTEEPELQDEYFAAYEQGLLSFLQDFNHEPNKRNVLNLAEKYSNWKKFMTSFTVKTGLINHLAMYGFQNGMLIGYIGYEDKNRKIFEKYIS